jgi:hypothetical protein
MEYSRLQEVNGICSSLIGETVNFLGRIGRREMLPLADSNSFGNIFEDLLFPLLKGNFPDFEKGLPQQPPDYLAGLFGFEVKTFNSNTGPGFDISNVSSLIRQLSEDLIKKMFMTKYLVFEYANDGTSFKIVNFWLLNLWQLPSYNSKYPLSLQNKNGQWYNFRPSSKDSWNDPQKTPQLFLERILKCIDEAPGLENREGLKNALLTQMELARTAGFL